MPGLPTLRWGNFPRSVSVSLHYLENQSMRFSKKNPLVGLVAILMSPLLDPLRTPYLVGVSFLLELAGTSALVAWWWGRSFRSRSTPAQDGFGKAFGKFALSSVVSAGVAVAVGWP